MTDLTAKTTIIETMSRRTGLERPLCEMLVLRGITDPLDAERYLHPTADMLSSPNTLKGMAEAVALVQKYLCNPSKILIYGDYDCDGIGASAILYLTLQTLGVQADVFIPRRDEEGYGLSVEGIDRAVERYRPDLIITVDCGITAVQEAAYIQKKGIALLVTDHHEPNEVLPDCLILNPKLQEGGAELCGAGVAFLLAEALTSRESALKYVDILAISTIADVVPLTGDNRVYARLGLDAMRKKPRAGIRALLERAGHKFENLLSSYDIAYKIAPRLNAAGRLTTAEKSFQLLTTDDPYLLEMLADELEAENRTRQALCAATIQSATEQLLQYDLNNRSVIVLVDDGWEAGVIGIAAAKLAQDFCRPVILLTKQEEGVLKGSGRSIEGVHLHAALSACAPLLKRFGGHEMAAGLALEEKNLPALVQTLEDYVKKNAAPACFTPVPRYTLELPMREVQKKLAGELDLLEPCGMGNPRPVFMERCAQTAYERIKPPHIQLKVRPTVSAIAFGFLPYLPVLQADIPKNVHYTVEKEFYQNRETVKCHVRGVYPQGGVSQDFLLAAYAKTFTVPPSSAPPKETRQPVFPLGERGGHLLIAFSEKTFDACVHTYPHYQRAIGVLQGESPANTVLLAPAPDAARMRFFTQIDVFDSPAATYVARLKNETRAVVTEQGGVPIFPGAERVTIEALRNTYTSLRILHGKTVPQERIFLELQKCGYKQTEQSFQLQYAMFCALSLIKLDARDIIHVNNQKVNLEDAALYRHIVVQNG